jgi:hypothetical protein
MEIPAEYKNALTDLLKDLAARLEVESQKSHIRSRLWVRIGPIFAIATPAAAFIAGFSGIKEMAWFPFGAVVWSFLAGFLGSVSMVVSRLSKTEGADERFRAEALDNLAWEVRRTLSEYTVYQQSLSKSNPVGAFTKEETILAWLADQNRQHLEQSDLLRKFIFRPEAPTRPRAASDRQFQSDQPTGQARTSPAESAPVPQQ